MRKIIIGFTSTVSGLVLLFSYHTSLNRPGTPEALSAESGGGGSGGESGGEPTATPSGSETTSGSDTATATDGSDPTPTTSASSGSTPTGGPGTSTTAGSARTTAGRTTAAGRATTKAPATTKAAPTTKAGTSGSFAGSVVDTRWGPVQVQITVKDNKIVSATALQYPTGNPRDEEINAHALPILNQEAVTAQSARIDAVSGATVTSNGYIASLQSAIDKAHL